MIEQNFLVGPLVDDWLMTYTNQGRSAGTVRTYRILLRGLVRWWETRHGRELRCRDLGDRDNGRRLGEQYLTYQRGQGWSAVTLKTMLAAARQFSRWLHESGYTAADTLGAVKAVRLPHRQIAIFTETEIGAVEDYLMRQRDGYDHLLLWRLLLGTGLRRAEAGTLRLAAATLIDGRGQPLRHGTLTVIGKGDKQRTVGAGLWLTGELRRYVREVRPGRLRPEEPEPAELLINQYGRPITADAISRRFERWAGALSLPKLHPHTCRHTFATNYIIAGGDLSELMILLGHANVQQTMHYVQLATTQHVIKRAQTLCPIDARLGRAERLPDARFIAQPGPNRALTPRTRAQSRRTQQAG